MTEDVFKAARHGLVSENARLRAENAGLHKSLERAAEVIVGLCGDCPVSYYGLSGDGCSERCGPDMERKCWAEYVTRGGSEAWA